MGENKHGRGDRKGSNRPTPVTAGSKDSRSSRLRRRRKHWWSGVVATVLATILATYTTGVLDHAAHAARGLFSSPAQPVISNGSTTALRRKHANSRPRKPQSPACLPSIVSEDPIDDWEVHAWIFPSTFVPSPEQIAQINEDRHEPASINQDLFDAGGYAPFTDTQFVLQNSCRQSETITDIQISKACQPSPLNGTIFVGQARLNEPSSPDDSTQLGFDLDSSDPEAVWTNGWNVGKWTQEYDDDGSLITIPGNEAHSIDIRVTAQHVACSFSIVLRVLYDGKTRVETIDDDGQLFRVSALLPGVLKPQRPGNHPYSGYGVLYVGWDESPWNDDTWARQSPSTWELSDKSYCGRDV